MEDSSYIIDTGFYETKYPHVFCDDDVISIIEKSGIFDGLTPLERAFCGWYVLLRSSNLAFSRLIDPAIHFDERAVNGPQLLKRKRVIDAIKRATESTVYESLYSRDYIYALLHDEISYYRSRNRKIRFDDPAFIDKKCTGGKKSIHEEELMESKIVMDCLTLLLNLKKSDDSSANGTASNTIGQPRSYDRLLGTVQDAIEGRQE